MTLIRMFFSRPEASGVLTAATGSLSWSPTRRRVVDGTPDNIVLPRAFSIPLVGGKADVTVAPTGADWVWRVDEYISGGAYTTIYVSVPNVAEIDYASLVQVDIDTLSPTAVPEPAWVAMAESTVTSGTVTGDSLILTRTDGTTTNAGNVRGPAGPSTTDASLLSSGTVPEGRLPARLSDVTLSATYASYVNLAKTPDSITTGAVTVDANNLVTSASVVWPDGKPGTMTITSRDANNAVLAYNITYGSPVTKTFTQPTITRNAAGAAVNVPQIVVS